MATPERYEDTTDPKNPPNSIVHPHAVGSTALYWNLGAIVVILVLVGVGAIFWLAAHPQADSTEDRVIGTSSYHTEGGHDPDPRIRTTRDELKFRGF